MKCKQFITGSAWTCSFLIAALVFWPGSSPVKGQDEKEGRPFGDSVSVDYAKKLWEVLKDHDLVGDDPLRTIPYEGTEPHGAVLETFKTKATVSGHSGEVWVKRNYGGKEIDPAKVFTEPQKFLKSTTVMFQRESGYDPDHQNWFWVKYNADGSVQKNPKGLSLAGRVAKGSRRGCIACHKAAPGGDYVFSNDPSVLNKK